MITILVQNIVTIGFKKYCHITRYVKILYKENEHWCRAQCNLCNSVPHNLNQKMHEIIKNKKWSHVNKGERNRSYLLDLPAKQWTKTPPPSLLASSIKSKHSLKYFFKSSSSLSTTASIVPQNHIFSMDTVLDSNLIYFDNNSIQNFEEPKHALSE